MKKTFKVKKSYLNNVIVEVYDEGKLIINELISEDILTGYRKCLNSFGYIEVYSGE